MSETSEAKTRDALFKCAAQGDVEGLRKLPVNLIAKPDATGLRAIHVAAQNGHVNVLEWLLEDPSRDQGVNEVDEDARSALHWAAWFGKAQVIPVLVTKGGNVNQATRTGFTPLHYVRLCFTA